MLLEEVTPKYAIVLHIVLNIVPIEIYNKLIGKVASLCFFKTAKQYYYMLCYKQDFCVHQQTEVLSELRKMLLGTKRS